MYKILFLILGSIGLLVSIYIVLFPKNSAWSKESIKFTETLPFVRLAPVVLKQAVQTISAIGIVKAAQGIILRSPVSGVVAAVNFKSGQSVQTGKVLIILQNNALKAILLRDSTKYHLAKLNADRSRKLIINGYIAHQDADQAIANAQQAKAQLMYDQALLERTVIKAPFSGELGISRVNLGQYFLAGDAIVSLQNLKKIVVDFFIPEKQSDMVAVGDKVIINSHQAILHQWSGEIVALGEKMDNATHSLPVRATIKPSNNQLIPNMYVNVSVILPATMVKSAIPQRAIIYTPYGNFVYIYKDGIAVQKDVIIGNNDGTDVFIDKGIKYGDQVIVDGWKKLFNGEKVRVAK